MSASAAPTSRTIGQLLADARERHGHSLRKASDALGVTDRMVKQWEADFAEPGWDKAERIARYTGEHRADVLVLLGIIRPEEGELLRQMDSGDGDQPDPDTPLGSDALGGSLTLTAVPDYMAAA